MCGRFSQTKSIPEIEKRFAIQEVLPDVPAKPYYNLSPSTLTPTVVSVDDERALEAMVWGIRLKNAPPGRPPVINLRTDSLAKGSFRTHLLTKCCIVPADGFYEWRKEGKAKIPVRFTMKDNSIFGFAALYAETQSGGPPYRMFSLFTTEANDIVAPHHDRMPVILRPQDESLWLDPEVEEAEPLLTLLRPYPAEKMKAYDVSPKLNNARVDSPDLIQPVEEKQRRLF